MVENPIFILPFSHKILATTQYFELFARYKTKVIDIQAIVWQPRNSQYFFGIQIYKKQVTHCVRH